MVGRDKEVAVEAVEGAFVEQRGVGDKLEAVAVFVSDGPPADAGSGRCGAGMRVG